MREGRGGAERPAPFPFLWRLPPDQASGSHSFALELLRTSLASISDEQAGEAGQPLRTLALVTTRYVEDEELFLNYRLNPANGYPPWYSPVDAEEDARRWTF